MKSVKRKTRVLTARTLMTGPVEFVTAGETMEKASALFVRRKIGVAPVIGPTGEPVGVVTKSDITRYEAGRRLAEKKFQLDRKANAVDAWMTRTIVSVAPDASAAVVANRMVRAHIHHVFVREELSGKILGVISSLDFVRRFQSRRR